MILWMLGLAFAADPEGERLSEELERYVKDRKWTAVERTYERLVASHPDTLNNLIHQSASKAARSRGDLLLAAQRLQRTSRDGMAIDAIGADLKNLSETTGLVMFAGKELTPASMPFAPDLRQAVIFAQEQIAANGYFVGLIPVGTYRLEGKEVKVEPGFRWQDAWTP